MIRFKLCYYLLLPLVCTTSATFTYSVPQPTFRDTTPREVSINPGQTAVLQCVVTSLGNRIVMWKKLDTSEQLTINMTKYKKDERLSISVNGDTKEWQLRIENSRKSDSGVYGCQVNVRVNGKYIQRKIRLRVRGKRVTPRPTPVAVTTTTARPAVAQSRYTSRYTLREPDVSLTGPNVLEQGRKLTLTCNATYADDKIVPQVMTWYKGSDVIESSDEAKRTVAASVMGRTLFSVLTIYQVKISDSGKYICYVPAREVQEFIEVQVISGPASPAKRGTPLTDKYQIDKAASTLLHRWTYVIALMLTLA